MDTFDEFCLALASAMLVVIATLLLVGMLAGTNGIYTHGEHAVFITGETRTVNTGQERTLEEIQSDLDWCSTMISLGASQPPCP